MRQIFGLQSLLQECPGLPNAQKLATRLLVELADCRCMIYGCLGEDDRIVLSQMHLLEDTLQYESFDQRIDFVVAGPILRNDCVPLTYRLEAGRLAIAGRCSMIGKVCGVDLYLQRSYTGTPGDIARQRFSLSMPSLLG